MAHTPIDRQTLRDTVVATLRTIAPEVAADELQDERPLRQQVDLDSMDWLNFLIGLHQRLAVDIPEADYAKLVSLRNLLDYLQARLSPPG